MREDARVSSSEREQAPRELRLEVARRYYHHDESKVAIAKALSLSRFQVARLLQEARRDGLVRIDIGVPGEVDGAASKRLADALGVERAVVVTGGGGADPVTVEHLGAVLARELAEQLDAGSTIGMTWSRSTVAMSHQLGVLPRCDVVQLAGAVYPPPGLPGSVEVTRRVATAGGGQAHPLYAPLVVADAATADGLRRQPEIADVLARSSALDVAVLSVGVWSASGSAVYDLLEPRERDDLAAAGVCGEISGRVFDRAGEPVRAGLDARVIGIEAATLAVVPRLITTSHGAHRAEATRAAILAGLVHTLIVDDALASALLA